jgi:protein dithiol oxidoreductase (disulfide-forming)
MRKLPARPGRIRGATAQRLRPTDKEPEMNRRNFAVGLATIPWAARTALAVPTEGRDYTRLSKPVEVAVPGKVEVIEFFGYWCPHCNAFEPRLEAWARQLPPYVDFRHEPVAWQPVHVPYQRLYFALLQLGLVKTLQQKVFDAVHVQHLRLETDAGIAVFASENGIDKSKLIDTMKGFTVDSEVRRANQLFKAYGLDGVPSLTVNGRYVTSPEMAGGEEQALQVVDMLIRKSRAGG